VYFGAWYGQGSTAILEGIGKIWETISVSQNTDIFAWLQAQFKDITLNTNEIDRKTGHN